MAEIREREKKLLETASTAKEKAYVLYGFRAGGQCLHGMGKSMNDAMPRAGFQGLEYAQKDARLITLSCMVTEESKK